MLIKQSLNFRTSQLNILSRFITHNFVLLTLLKLKSNVLKVENLVFICFFIEFLASAIICRDPQMLAKILHECVAPIEICVSEGGCLAIPWLGCELPWPSPEKRIFQYTPNNYETFSCTSNTNCVLLLILFLISPLFILIWSWLLCNNSQSHVNNPNPYKYITLCVNKSKTNEYMIFIQRCINVDAILSCAH